MSAFNKTYSSLFVGDDEGDKDAEEDTDGSEGEDERHRRETDEDVDSFTKKWMWFRMVDCIAELTNIFEYPIIMFFNLVAYYHDKTLWKDRDINKYIKRY